MSIGKRKGVVYNQGHSGRGSARLEHTVRDREVGGSNPLAPTNLGPHPFWMGPFFNFDHSG